MRWILAPNMNVTNKIIMYITFHMKRKTNKSSGLCHNP